MPIIQLIMSYGNQPASYSRVIAALLLATASPSSISAEPAKPINLPSITIYGDSSANTDPFLAKTVSSVSYQDLNQSGKRDISAILQGMPSVSSGSVNRGYPVRLSLRGSTSALGIVTIDDVPLFSTNHNLVNLAPYTSESMESMEIIRGPSAYRYGNTPLGGVIRLSTRDNKTNNALLRVEGGSFDTLSETLGASVIGRQGRATVTLNRDDIFTGSNLSDRALGNREKDGFYSSSGIGRYTLNPSARLELSGSLLYTNSKAQLDDYRYIPCRVSLNIGGYPCNWLNLTDGKQAFIQTDTWLTQHSAALNLSQHWQSTLKLGLSEQDNEYLLFNTPSKFNNRLLLSTWTNQHDYNLGGTGLNKLSVRWGGDIREESGQGQVTRQSRTQLINKQRTTTAGFTDVDITINDWTASAGVRLNHFQNLGTHPNYYLGLAWQVLPELSLRGSAGVAYRPPTINQLWTPLLSNPLLKPERAVSGELGIAWQPSDKFNLEVTGFYSRYRNMIAFVPDDSVISHVNAANVLIQGLEWQWRYSPWKIISVGTDYTYTDAFHADYHRNLTNIPVHSSRFFADWHPKQVPVSVYMEGIYNSGLEWQNSATTRIGVADRIRFNAQINYQIKPNAKLYLRGENLSNDLTPINPSYGTAGIAVYGGFKISMY